MDRLPGVWRHADFIVKNPKTKGFIILGRRYEVPISLGNPHLIATAAVMAYSILAAFASARRKYTPYSRTSKTSWTIPSVSASVGQKTKTSVCFCS